jgi:hypothetical protein
MRLGLALPAIPLLLCWAGCSPDHDVEATIAISDAIPTVVTVSWAVSGDDVVGGYVQFGRTRDYGRSTLATLDDEGTARAVLLGLEEDTEIHLRVVEVVDAESLLGPDEVVTTGSLPSDLPSLELSLDSAIATHGGYLVTSVLAQPAAAVIVNADGRYVWAHRPPTDWDSLFINRVFPSVTGEAFLYHAATSAMSGGFDGESARAIVRVGLDGAGGEVMEIPDVHHDFVERPEGTLAVIKRDRRMTEGELVEGDQLVEVAPDGSETVIWTVWDHIEYDPDEVTVDDGSGWVHANAVDHDPDQEAYYLSLRNLNSILKIDRATGDVLWTLGGLRSDFTLDGGTRLFEQQHQFEVLGDRVLVFDNGTVEQFNSRVVEYRLDEATGTVELLWEHRDDPPLYNLALGDVSRLPQDHTLITWSSQGQVDEVTRAGDVVWRLRADMGAGLGYTTWLDSLD